MGKGKAVDKIIKEHRRALVGLAHYDKGKKVKGCDCCFCSPTYTAPERGKHERKG